ncbi:MAG: hypothetical protein HWN69_07045 [Desulfobacterales bacterium]|nr:hypothetical protein [Desulfobacterales bacterium]
MFPLAKTPARVKVRIWENCGYFYVLRRFGECWESISRHKTRDRAATRVELEMQLMDWAEDVKMRAHYTCEVPGCWERDKALLHAHHKKPKSTNPEDMLDPENGECVCIWHHAVRHWANKVVRNMILAKLGFIEGVRKHPEDKKLVA